MTTPVATTPASTTLATDSARRELSDEKTRLEAVERLLGIAFRDRALLLQALTHRSFLNERTSSVGYSERLELLGDAVLSLVTVEELLRVSPDAQEGELTERRAAHVSTEALAKAARGSGVLVHIRAARGLRPPNVVPDKLAADIVESVLGATYADAGLDAARALCARLLGAPPQQGAVIHAQAKRFLQERLQAVFGRPPEYVVERLEGPNHAPIFRASAIFRGDVIGVGDGANKRNATEAAAVAALGAFAGFDDDALRGRFTR